MLVLQVERDEEMGRLRTEVWELEKDKRQLMELVGQKDLVISEKAALVNSYLEKMVSCIVVLHCSVVC